MTTLGVGSIPLNVQAKVEHDEDLKVWFEQLKLDMQRHSKVLRWSKTKSLHLIRQCGKREIDFLTQYHELEKIHG
jgi:hypothetical protein